MQRWVAFPISHRFRATQKEEAVPGGQTLEAGHPHNDKAQLTFPTPKMGTHETLTVPGATEASVVFSMTDSLCSGEEARCANH